MARAWVDGGDQVVDLRLIDVFGGRRDLLPVLLLLAVLVLGLGLLERGGRAVADDFEPRRVERAGVEEILLAVLAAGLLQLVERATIRP